MLKSKYLDEGVRYAVNLSLILLDEKSISISELALIIYNLCEIDIGIEKLLEELIVSIISLELVE